jgi:hypothetical protein
VACTGRRSKGNHPSEPNWSECGHGREQELGISANGGAKILKMEHEMKNGRRLWKTSPPNSKRDSSRKKKRRRRKKRYWEPVKNSLHHMEKERTSGGFFLELTW